MSVYESIFLNIDRFHGVASFFLIMVSSDLDRLLDILLNDDNKRLYLTETVGLKSISDFIGLAYKRKLKYAARSKRDILNHNDPISGCPLSFEDRFCMKLFVIWWLEIFCSCSDDDVPTFDFTKFKFAVLMNVIENKNGKYY